MVLRGGKWIKDIKQFQSQRYIRDMFESADKGSWFCE